MIKLKLTGDIQDLKLGLAYIKPALHFEEAEDGIPLHVQKGDTLCARLDNSTGEISYITRASFFRMLTLFLMNAREQDRFEIREEILLKHTSVMLDVSRNGVLTIESIKEFITYMAAMGLNGLCLYMEDVFEVKERPYFGYMRGRYTYEELKQIDDFAYALGVEAYPNIEVLGHMAQYLKYLEAENIRDTDSCLLVGSEETYRFLELLITTATKPFRSGRIGLSMDEAHDLGMGNYLKQNGYKNKIDIFLAHLNRVAQIAEKYDLTPAVSGDMFFRLASKTGQYYDKNVVFTNDIIEKVPPNVTLGLWYYRGVNPDGLVESLFENQRKLSEKMQYMGSAWNFRGQLCDQKFGLENVRICLPLCKEYHTPWVQCNMFGDDGTECNAFYILPTVQAYAEHMYNQTVTPQQVSERFAFITGASFEAFVRMSDYNGDFDRIENPGDLSQRFVGKKLFWQDILMGLVDEYLFGTPMDQHYSILAQDLHAYGGENDRWNAHYRFAELLCDALALKCEIAQRLQSAYLNGDRAYLSLLISEKLPQLRTKINRLKNLHREMWHKTYKPFGFECLDLRYGGLLARIETAEDRISAYLERNITKLEELEEVRLPNKVRRSFAHRVIYSASAL